jgi:hypothetical protein
MIKTDPTMLVCNHTPGPWTAGSVNAGESFQFGPDAVDNFIGEIFCQHRPPASQEEDNIRLVCAAPPLLKVAQKLLLWMEECMAACDFNQDDIDLYHELRQTIRTAGGFSSETHWWQGPCICDACGHAWQGVVEIPVEATGPQVPLECGECHQMTGGPA